MASAADIIDLNTVNQAFAHLSSDAGAPALDFLHNALEDFRGKLNVSLNDAELKYVAGHLIEQRSNRWSSVGAATGSRSPDAAFNLKHGFVIKAKI